MKHLDILVEVQARLGVSYFSGDLERDPIFSYVNGILVHTVDKLASGEVESFDDRLTRELVHRPLLNLKGNYISKVLPDVNFRSLPELGKFVNPSLERDTGATEPPTYLSEVFLRADVLCVENITCFNLECRSRVL